MKKIRAYSEIKKKWYYLEYHSLAEAEYMNPQLKDFEEVGK